jgi:transposase
VLLADVDGGEELVIGVRLRRRAARRCGRCGRRAGRYDKGGPRRRWRHLDFAAVRVFVEAAVPRVNCPEHGPTTMALPWARHASRFTTAFEDTAAWLTARAPASAVAQYLRTTWRSVTGIVERVVAEAAGTRDQLDGLRRIGIDEVSYRKGHRYLVVVVDHDTGRLVWAGQGRDEATVEAFFDALGPERTARITHVSADGAHWIAKVLARRCPQAVACADAFHVVKWATDALDLVRRQTWNAASGRRRGGPQARATGDARTIKNARWALWRNPEDLTEAQQAKLDWIAKTHPTLYRAWALKEGLRTVFAAARASPAAAEQALDRWISWARRCRIAAFVDLQRRVVRHRATILNTIHHGLSNGLVESMNTKIRLITRVAFGFKSPEALIALAMLSLGGHPPKLPNR